MFDRFVIVDWSAANSPKTGKDSIWISRQGCEGDDTSNPSTRSAALAEIEAEMSSASKAGQRLFVGLDFAFGYPADATNLPGGGHWEPLWAWLAANVRDEDDNRTNRFDVAADLNSSFAGDGPFWGHPWQHKGRYLGIEATKPDYEALGVRERRHIDRLVPKAQPVWKLAYTGSVGSQALTGIARVEALRHGRYAENIAIWPFETGFADDLSKPIVVAEIYPSLFTIDRTLSKTPDEAQVRTLSAGFAALDASDDFTSMLDGPRALDEHVRADALSHEGWMVGFTDKALTL